MRLMPCGDTAVLAEVGDLPEVLALYQELAREPAAGVVDLVPAAGTVLVRFDPATTTADAVGGWVAATRYDADAAPAGRTVDIPVVYDGADLEATAEAVGWSVEDLVCAHAKQRWLVGFAGFMPGFAYLVADGEWPRVPRREDPRTSVPAGSVALADRFSGVYPRSTPGGWQLIGRTDVALWDLAADPPALLVPGSIVRFVDAT
jgi:KipI family sensor histidine kinase inhibitor